MNYINFELGFYDKEANTRIIKVFENARKSLTTAEAQKIINNRYREYLLERGNNVQLLNKIPFNPSTDLVSEKTEQSPLKRPLVENDDNSYSKQARYDSYSTFGQQQQQQQQPQANYATSYYNQQ
jgi:hypothetical protein